MVSLETWTATITRFGSRMMRPCTPDASGYRHPRRTALASYADHGLAPFHTSNLDYPAALSPVSGRLTLVAELGWSQPAPGVHRVTAWARDPATSLGTGGSWEQGKSQGLFSETSLATSLVQQAPLPSSDDLEYNQTENSLCDPTIRPPRSPRARRGLTGPLVCSQPMRRRCARQRSCR